MSLNDRNSKSFAFFPDPFGRCGVHDDAAELCEEVPAERAAGVLLSDGGAQRPRKVRLKINFLKWQFYCLNFCFSVCFDSFINLRN